MRITSQSHPALVDTLRHCFTRHGDVSAVDVIATTEEVSYLETSLSPLSPEERATFADGEEKDMERIMLAYDIERANDLLNRIYDSYFFGDKETDSGKDHQ